MADALKPGEWRSLQLEPGDRVRIEALVAGATGELIAHRRSDPRERLSTTLTTLVEYVHETHPGLTLWSQHHEPLLRVTDQTHGRHDLELEACTTFVNRDLCGHDVDYSCAGNFATAVAELGLAPKWIPYPLGVFRRAGIRDGRLQMLPGSSRRGDHLELEACVPVTVAVSVCPPADGDAGTPTIALSTRERA